VRISYQAYLNKIYGGWLGKSIGGTIGARFEGQRKVIDIAPGEFFPEVIPPNDDLDLQMLWLKVLEEKGAAFTSRDLADAWLEGCWYPFNEYGMFRRNWKLGIAPPVSGAFANPFWQTGMGCPIRSEIWGYVNPGEPDRAVAMAEKDGTLDHTAQSVGAEKMFAAMAAMAFEESNIRKLIDVNIHYLPAGSPIEQLCRIAIAGYDAGAPLLSVRERILAHAPCVEACDAQINVPFIICGLLYGEGDLAKMIPLTLSLGFDTDCTLATAAAFLGQILGANGIPDWLKKPLGDDLVMGIEYHRPDMTITGVAKDTARVGVLLSQGSKQVTITDAPQFKPISFQPPRWELAVDYHGLPSTAAGETKQVTLRCTRLEQPKLDFTIEPPVGWTVAPASGTFTENKREFLLTLKQDKSREWLPQKNIFTVKTDGGVFTFGVMGAEYWRLLGVYAETEPIYPLKNYQCHYMGQSFIDIDKTYLADAADGDAAYKAYSKLMGRPMVLAVRELIVDLADAIPLKSHWVAYLERVFHCPRETEAQLFFGHTVPIDAWLNGVKLGREHEPTVWYPLETFWSVKLNAGENRIRVRVAGLSPTVPFSSFVKLKSSTVVNGKVLDAPHSWDITSELADANPYML